MQRPRIAISRCLLGERVRYDGGSRHEPCVIEPLQRVADFEPLCPEVECGMPVPREPAEIGGTPLSPAFVCLYSGRNLTPQLMPWVRSRIEEFATRPVHGMVLKRNSPSCAVLKPKAVLRADGSTAGWSLGLFARAFRERFPGVPVADEVVLADPRTMEDFLRRVCERAARSCEC